MNKKRFFGCLLLSTFALAGLIGASLVMNQSNFGTVPVGAEKLPNGHYSALLTGGIYDKDGSSYIATGNGGEIKVSHNGDTNVDGYLVVLGGQDGNDHIFENISPIGKIYSITVDYEYNIPDNWTKKSPELNYGFSMNKDNEGNQPTTQYIHIESGKEIKFIEGHAPSYFKLIGKAYSGIKVKSIKLEYGCSTHNYHDEMKKDLKFVGTHNGFDLTSKVDEKYRFTYVGLKEIGGEERHLYECTLSLKKDDKIKLVVGNDWNYYTCGKSFGETNWGEDSAFNGGKNQLGYDSDNNIVCNLEGTYTFQVKWKADYSSYNAYVAAI